MFARKYLSITLYKRLFGVKPDAIHLGGIMKSTARGLFGRVPVVVVITAAAIATMTATPAAAGGGTVTTTGQSGNHLYSATATVNVAPFPKDNKVVVILNCQAEGSPDASATTISTCSVGTTAAPAISVPGDAAATAAVGVVPAGIQGSLCIAGSASFVEGSLGGSVVNGPERCVPVGLSVGSSVTISL